MENFAGLVKRHLAEIFLRLSLPDCVVLESPAITTGARSYIFTSPGMY